MRSGLTVYVPFFGIQPRRHIRLLGAIEGWPFYALSGVLGHGVWVFSFGRDWDPVYPRRLLMSYISLLNDHEKQVNLHLVVSRLRAP
jgi:hypothetical protein